MHVYKKEYNCRDFPQWETMIFAKISNSSLSHCNHEAHTFSAFSVKNLIMTSPYQAKLSGTCKNGCFAMASLEKVRIAGQTVELSPIGVLV